MEHRFHNYLFIWPLATSGSFAKAGPAGTDGCVTVGGTAGIAGVAGLAGFAGFAGTAGVVAVAGIAGIARVAGVAGIAGVAGVAVSATAFMQAAESSAATMTFALVFIINSFEQKFGITPF